MQLEQQTAAFLGAVYRAESSPNNEALAAASDYYADQVSYFGNSYSHDQVMAELQASYDRFPIRQYQMEQNSLEIDCNGQSLTCTAKGLLDFDGKSPERNQHAFGSATFDYVLKFESATSAPKIVQEAGDVRARNLVPLSNQTFPPGQTWNGCPPNYTVQGGICKPYQGGNTMPQQQNQQMMDEIFRGVIQRIGH